jgi:hypothetical protein
MARSWKITGFVAILLFLMVLSHYVTGTTPEELSANKHKTETANSADHKTKSEGHGKPVPLPAPIGAKNAAVKINVYVTADNTCDTTTVEGMQGIANKYPGKVFVQFLDLNHAETAKAAQKAKISCKSGITINGMAIMHVPGRGVRGLVMFDGPMGQKNYSLEDVDAAVKHLVTQNSTKGQKAAPAKTS